MPAFLVPFVVILAGGALATGAGIGVIESKKAKAAKAAEVEQAKKTANDLVGEIQAHLSSGALYPAFRAFRRYIDHVENKFDVSPKIKAELERSYDDIRGAALSEYRKLDREYRNELAAIENDEEGEKTYEVQSTYLVKLEKLLGAGAPKLKALEESFGINYAVHKYGVAVN
ncbi:hypothetical protein [Pseudomonas sp. L1(2025)]|uniref:hypothetical protein n=1 Tax=Pseudomonas sp. L1(2025) TaxID=3449429 RepID=UPI003F68D680